MSDDEMDILEFLLSSEFENLSYSSDQYLFFLRKYQKYYKILNAKCHRIENENKNLKLNEQKVKDQLVNEKRSNSIDKAKFTNIKKELKKKLSIKERIFGKLIGRFDPDNI